MSRISFISVFAIYLSAVSPAAPGQESYWNQFRGPNGNGKSPAKNLPVEFNESSSVQWKTPIHDRGWSSPVVWGDQIWLTTARDDGSELFAIAVDLKSGEIIHDIKVFDVPEPQLENPELNTHATPTPVVEDGRVYVHFGDYGTACLDTKSGEKLWERRDLKCNHRVRAGSSPVIDGDSLFISYDGIEAQFAISLDKNTGETIWRQDRSVYNDQIETMMDAGLSRAQAEMAAKRKPDDNRKSYATPAVIEFEGRKQLISPASEVTYAYDPETGEELWRVRHEGWGWNVTCRPIFENGLVYLTMGVARRVVAVRPSGSGDVTDTHIVWSAEGRVPEIAIPLVIEDLFFMVEDKGGIMTCLDAITGERIWKERLGDRGQHWASPVYADGKIYVPGEKGVITVIAAAREYQVLAENQLDGRFNASPAIADDALILRSFTHLYRIEGATDSD